MKNLFTFSTSSWHAKLFYWVYNQDPTKTFKTMCPYFWSMLLTIIFLPIVLIVKLFGRKGTKILNSIRCYQANAREKYIQAFIKEAEETEFTPATAYFFYKRNCYDKYNWYLDYNLRQKIFNLYYEELKNKKKGNYKRQAKRQVKINNIKENRVLKSFVWIIGFALACVILFYTYAIGKYTYLHADWPFIGKVTGTVILASCILILLGYLIHLLIEYLSNKTKCFETITSKFKQVTSYAPYLLSPFIWIIKGIAIIITMIVASYKTYCPLITWK